jgi:beta-N-acetylhexosaminidase
MRYLSSLFLLLTILSPPVPAAPKALAPDQIAWQFAGREVKKLSVEEKVGQLIHIGINARFANQDSEYFQALKRDVVGNKVGGIILFGAPVYESVVLVNRMQEQAKIPLLISADAETGIGMRFGDTINLPWNMAVAATGDPEYARKTGVIAGREARALGIRQVFAPVLDVNNNPDNPVINVRSYGEDPETVGRFGAAFILGVQSQRVIATAKHFPGHGDTGVDSHRGLPVLDRSLESLERTELVPFRRAITAGVGSIMIAHIGVPQLDPTESRPLNSALRIEAEEGAELVDAATTIPASLSSSVQTDLLRKRLNFNGLIVSDALGMSGLTLYYNQRDAGVLAFLAGADILEKPADTDVMRQGLIDAVRSGRISQARLDESVRKIIAWKFELGLYKQRFTPLNDIDRIVSAKDVAVLADEIAEKAMTLVRNDANAIPLDRSKKFCLLAVSNGFEGDATITTLSRELRAAGILFDAVVLQENSSAQQIAKANEMAAAADIVIAALYGRVRTGAKNSVGLPESGAGILRSLIAENKNVIGIAYGNPYILRSFPQLSTYMVAYGDMPSLQRASVKALLGTQDITGKLPISLPGLYARGTGIQWIRK